MGYYLRSLSKGSEQMLLAELRTKLKISAPNAAISIEGGNESSWTQPFITTGDCEV